VADELRALGADVAFAGTPDRVEATLVPAAGYPFDSFRVSGLERRPSLALARAALEDAVAPLSCVRILRRRRARAVLAGGGYVAGPMALAARSLGIPVVLTEADSHLGLANRLAAPLARSVYLAFPVAGRDGARYRVVGRPVARRFFETRREDARAALELEPGVFVLAVFGALAGAQHLNEACVATFGDGSLDGVVLHLSGERDLPWVSERVTAPASRYRLAAASDRFHEVLAAADLAVARAGGSVFELAAAGLPAILVPYPYATADHQRLNAEHFVREGAARLVPDRELDAPRLRREVESLRAAPQALAAMAEAMRRLARPEAARLVAERLLVLAGEREAA
jgi:UDP-N-acetylglucosamine--N-acetylmuramyl-(pentapeptide) pyrophosphoryl-undecaprenol N-acetylglucosamine transferase